MDQLVSEYAVLLHDPRHGRALDTQGRRGLRPANQSQALTLAVPQTSVRYDGEPVARHFDAPVDRAGTVGYVELPWDGGWAEYATRAQRAIRAVDTAVGA